MKKLYPDEDINDIIESEEKAFFKGGPGSGIRGHKTPKIELRPNRPDFDQMSRTEECQWNVNKYKRLVRNYPKNRHFREELEEWERRLAHWKKVEGK